MLTWSEFALVLVGGVRGAFVGGVRGAFEGSIGADGRDPLFAAVKGESLGEEGEGEGGRGLC